MTALPTTFPRVPLKQMDASMLVFELDRETQRLMPEHAELITSAATMASFLHRKQTRFVRGGLPRVPYIEHPLRVALRLIRWGVRESELVAAALLHDVIEDCAEELGEVFDRRPHEDRFEHLARLFGDRVAEFVSDVTNPTDGTGYQEHVEALAGSGSRSLLLKAGDLKDNAGSIRHQLGHGQDQRMLRMLAKYLPAVRCVADALRMRLVGPESAEADFAAADLDALFEDLQRLAKEHDVA